MVELNVTVPILILTLIVGIIIVSIEGFEVFADAPLPPTLTVGTITDTTVELTWTQTSSNHNTDVFMCEGTSCTPTTQVGNNEDSPYNVTALTPNTLYRFQVEESHGGNNAFSNIIEASTTDSSPPPSGETSPPINFIAEQIGNSIKLQWDYHPSDTVDPEKIIISRQELGDNYKKLTKEKDHKATIKNKKGGLITDFYLDTETGTNPGPPLVNHTYRYEIDIKYLNNDKHVVESNFVTLEEEIRNKRVAEGHLIQTTGLTPISPIISWFDWLNPFKLVQAEIFVNSTYVSSLNPTESFRIALEPIPLPNGTDNCNEVLQYSYSRNEADGQDFNVTASLFQNDTSAIPNYQKTWSGFSNEIDVKHDWLVINPPNQTLTNYEDVEVQFDIVALPGDHRTLTFWDVFFFVPSGIGSVC